MKKDVALIVAGVVFSLVAVAHLLRLLQHFIIIIAGYTVPQNFSVAGFIISLILAIWMFYAAKK